MENSGKQIGKNLDAGLMAIGLTSREIQILRQLALGKGDRQIATDLLISVKTVNHHVSNIILKLDAKNRTHAVAKALLAGQIEMRVTDAPARILNRRLCDQDKVSPIRVVTTNMPLSAAGQKQGHLEGASQAHILKDSVQSESAA